MREQLEVSSDRHSHTHMWNPTNRSPVDNMFGVFDHFAMRMNVVAEFVAAYNVNVFGLASEFLTIKQVYHKRENYNHHCVKNLSHERT